MKTKIRKPRPYIRRIERTFASNRDVTSQDENAKPPLVRLKLIAVDQDNKVKQLTMLGLNLDEKWVTTAFLSSLVVKHQKK